MRSVLLMVSVCSLVLLMTWGCTDDDNPVDSGGEQFDVLYVLNQADQTIYKYNAETLVRIDSIETPVVEPHFIEFSHDRDYYYVVGRQVGGQLAKYRTADDSLVQLVTVEGSMFPTALVVSPNDDTVYVCDFTNAKGRTHRYAASGASFSFLDSNLQAGYQSHDIDLSSDGGLFVSAGFNSDDITVVDLDSGTTTPYRIEDATPGFGTSPASYGPYGVNLDLDEQMAILACRKGVDQLRLIDFINGTVIDSILIPTADATQSAMAGPTLMDITPDNDRVFVTGFTDNRMWVVQLSTRSVLQTIPLGTPRPFTVNVTSDGSRVYVSATNTRPSPGQVYVIDGNSYAVLDSVQTGSEPFGVRLLER
ncbi:beta-propeller fold lactonase family protein [candidate division GN15 bacterium]|nr:beta-propeller fold lactonase family protein [candidate division GN15 bacterium]